MTEYIGSPGPGAFATMAGTEEFFTAETADGRFEFGLDMLLGGLVAMTG